MLVFGLTTHYQVSRSRQQNPSDSWRFIQVFIELAGEINTAMPEHIVHRIAAALNYQRRTINGSRILILGLAYKPNVDDERESPSYVLMNLLAERGAEVAYHDPYVPVIKPTREHPQFAGRKSVEWNRATIRKL